MNRYGFYKNNNTILYVSSSVQLLHRVSLFETPWTAAHQASLSITNSQRVLKLTSVELVMPSSHLILCCPPLLLPRIPPSIRIFSKLGKEYINSMYFHSAYLTSMQSTSSVMQGWINHKVESRKLGEISTTSDMQMIPL